MKFHETNLVPDIPLHICTYVSSGRN